jgi:hypothetical protein
LLGILYCAGAKANAQQVKAPESVITKAGAQGVSATVEDSTIAVPKTQEEAALPDDPISMPDRLLCSWQLECWVYPYEMEV